MYNCVNVEFGSYNNIIILKHRFYPKNSVKKYISIDACLKNEILDLWDKGIQTVASCCGHNIQSGTILVIREDFDKMLDLGYKIWKNPIKDCPDGFYAKSV
jgi:hypothetical protein